MPAMLSEHGQKSIAPEGAPTEQSAQLCRSEPCPRCSWKTDRKASRPRALLQGCALCSVGAGHARDALRRRPQPADGRDALRAMPPRVGDVCGRHAADRVDRQRHAFAQASEARPSQ